ncbi:NADPH-dependent diflavin oxidoreductase 1 [Daucus carota subsp. sativus]|uniref:NADPH-dependent diflavin oxidoreductase 1 n=1 Tax=Daucus carota subsp. sativus TaxID=79200 RepID=UPI003083DCE1
MNNHETSDSLKKMVVIVYASQTGNAMDAAERIGRDAERRGCPVAVVSIDEFDATSLPCEENVIFVVSTTGQGDTPDPMKAFWKHLLQRSLSHDWLKGVRYAVFGLGDSGYQKYNFVAKKLDKRLRDLGAVAIIERGLGDDQHPSGYEGALDPWMSSLWNALYRYNPDLLPRGPNITMAYADLMDQPKFKIIYHVTNNLNSQFQQCQIWIPLK